MWYTGNTSFDYLTMYNRAPTRTSLKNFDSFDDFATMLKLWPRENVYVYVLNRADTAQEFKIAYSGASHLLSLTASATSLVASTIFLFSF